MQLDLKGKRALVTGSSSGIGLGIAETLIAEGCTVALCARDGERLAKVAERIGASAAIVGDVSRPDDAARVVDGALKNLGALDILICNVGSGRSVPAGEEDSDEWSRMFDLNFFSATNMIEAARTHLERSQGVIVCISSICGLEVVAGAPLTYSAAKAALTSYVHGSARQLAKQGVRINAVAPGNIQFEDSVWARRWEQDRENTESMLAKEVSLGRLGNVSEVADVVAFLASPRAAFVTGAVWVVDGGQIKS